MRMYSNSFAGTWVSVWGCRSTSESASLATRRASARGTSEGTYSTAPISSNLRSTSRFGMAASVDGPMSDRRTLPGAMAPPAISRSIASRIAPGWRPP